MNKNPLKVKNNKEFCVLCLTVDRKLSENVELTHMFNKYFSEIKMVLPELQMCWECVSMVRKIEMFRKKIELAQKLITLYSLNSLSNPWKSFSKLTTVVIKEQTEKSIKSEEKGLSIPADTDKEEQAVKIEPDTYDDIRNQSDYEYLDIDEDFKTEDIDKIPLVVNKESTNRKIKKNYELDNKYIDKHDDFIAKDIDEMLLIEKKPRKRFKQDTDPPYEVVYTKEPSKYIKTVQFDAYKLDSVVESERDKPDYKKLKFKCSYKNCLHAYNKVSELKEHEILHSQKKNTYHCSICLVNLSSENALHSHTRDHYTMYECRICIFTTYASNKGLKVMLEHATSHLDTVRCLECNMLVCNKSMYRAHKKEHVFYCDDCNQTRRSKYMMRKHIQFAHLTYKCPVCGYALKSRKRYRAHYATRHELQRDETTFCVPCNRQYDNYFQFRVHINNSNAHSHERKSSKTHPCPDCGKVYSRRVYMTNHYLHVHKNQAKFECEFCGKQCLNRTRYIQHKAYKHEGKAKEKNKLCTICGRGFSTTRILVHHIRTHTGERPFECEFCPSKFSQSAALKTHIKHIHLKAKRKTNWHQ